MKASLNHIFRTIWSDALNTWVAVSEITSAKGKRSSSCVLNAAALADIESAAGNLAKYNRLRIKSIAIALACCFSLNAQANPIGAQVANGTASLNQSGNLLTITNSPNAIINWQSFSINSGETTRFIQQSASSSVLNRVTGADPSVLLGTLTSNGRVFLINPAGIMVGQGARIDVPGFVASTLNLSDSNFLAGKLKFDATPNAGAIQNNGTITTPEGGTVYLVAPQVENNGIINTPKGETILAAGDTVQLIDTGTPGVTVQITGSSNAATNLGEILADSGRIGVVGAVVRNSGTISANSLVSQGGRIFLKATNRVEAGGMISAQGVGGGNISVLADMKSGTVNVTGKLDASAPNSGNGGFIETSAAHVQVADTARITTVAANGNMGSWLIDPFDFVIAAAGGDITGTLLSSLLSTNSVVISTLATGTNSATNLYGATGNPNGDIFVNDSVNWSSTSSLTLNALRDINITAPINGAGALSATAGRNFNVTDTQVITGNQTINVGGNLNLTASTSFTQLQSKGTQTINFTGASAHQMNVLGGTGANAGADANVESLGLQTIGYAGTLAIALTGGSTNNNINSSNVYVNNVQTGTVVCTLCATWNWAGIQSDGGQTINASTITLNGGSGGNGNYANIQNKSATVAQNITTTGAISLTGGTAPGVYNPLYPNDSVTNDASIHSDGVQTIHASSITLNGGGDVGTLGGAFLTGKVSQAITTTGNLSMTGGASTASGQYGLGAPVVIGEQYGANITLTVGGSLLMTGGSSASPALIGSAQGTPTISITAATIAMVSGGSSSGIGVLPAGGSPAGTLSMTATGSSISQDASSYITTANLNVTDSYGGSSISLLGANKAGHVAASASSSSSIVYNSSGAVTFVYNGNIGTGNSLNVSASTGNISIQVNGTLADNGNITVSTPGTATINASGNMSITGALTNTGGLSLDAPTVNITGGSVTANGGDASVTANNLTISNGGYLTSVNNNVTANVTGDIRVNNGSYIQAHNDVVLNFSGATSTLYLNESSGMQSPSYILTNPIAFTTKLNFLTRTSGGVVIDGVETLSSTAGGSGIFFHNTSTPAIEGTGLVVTYFQQNLSQIVTALMPPTPTTTTTTQPASGSSAAPLVVVITTPPTSTESTMPSLIGPPGSSIGGTPGTFGGTESANGSSGAESGSAGDKGNGKNGESKKDTSKDEGKSKDGDKDKSNAKPEKC